MSSKRSKSSTQVEAVDATSHLPLFRSARERSVGGEHPRDCSTNTEPVSTGLDSLDRVIGGGFPAGRLTLVAARTKVGATSLLVGAALAAIKRGEGVAYFSERLKRAQIRGRFVILESRVNGHRARAGILSDEDRLALDAARARLPWNLLAVRAQRRLDMEKLEDDIFAYQPRLVLADFTPRGAAPEGENARLESLLAGLEDLATVAKNHGVAMVVRLRLFKGEHPPDIIELPGLGRCAEAFEHILLLHREGVGATETGSSDAEIVVARRNGRQLAPKRIPLIFDQRFAGLLEPRRT